MTPGSPPQQQHGQLRATMPAKRKIPCRPVFLLMNVIGVVLVVYGIIQLTWAPSESLQNVPSWATTAPVSPALRKGGGSLAAKSATAIETSKTAPKATRTTTNPEKMKTESHPLKKNATINNIKIKKTPPKPKPMRKEPGEEGEDMEGFLDPEELKELQEEAKEEKWEELLGKYPGLVRPNKTKPKET